MRSKSPRRWGWAVVLISASVLWLVVSEWATPGPGHTDTASRSAAPASGGPQLAGMPTAARARSTTPEAHSTEGTEELVVQVMDLRSGAALRDAKLNGPAAAGDLATDASGRLRVAPSALAALLAWSPSRSIASVVDPAPPPPGIDRVLWVAPLIRLRLLCTLRSREPLGAEHEITVRVLAPFRPSAPWSPSPGSHQSEQALPTDLARLGLARRKEVLLCDREGAVMFDVPHVPSQGVSVSLPGFLSEYVEVPQVPANWGEPPLVDIQVVLHPCRHVVRGTLRGPDGRAIANQRVSLLVLRRLDASALNAHAEAAKGEPVGIAVRNDGRDAFVKTMASATTDAEGRFSIETRSSGDAVLVVTREGLPISRTEILGFEGEQAMDLTLREPTSDSGARLLHAGFPVGPGTLHVADMSRDPQLWFVLRVSSEGRIPTRWFEPGIHYDLTFFPDDGTRSAGSLGGATTWAGQSELEVAGDPSSVTVTGAPR